MKIKNYFYLFLLFLFILASCTKEKEPPPIKEDIKVSSEIKKETPEGTPKIEFEQTVFDFGEADQHTKVTHVFKFKNTGNADLKLVNVRPTCGCTVPKWSRDPVPPGGTGEIEIVYNTENDINRISKMIKIETNEPEKKITTLEIRGNVRGYLVVLPNNGINFGNVESGYKFARKVKIYPDRADSLKIKQVTKTNGDFFDFKTNIQKDRINNVDKDVMMIEVTLKSGYIGPQRGEIIVETEHTQAPRLSIQITANIKSKITLSRNKVNLFFQNQDFVHENIFISSSEQVKIKGVKVKNNLIRTKLSELESGRLYSLAVWADLKKNDWKNIQDEIIIQTSLEGEPEIKIDVNIQKRN